MKLLRAFAEIFISFFKIGLFTIGGGYAMLPLIEREVVTRRQWIDPADFLDALAIAQSLPGPVAINTSVYTGYRTRGIPGALVALLGVTLPSIIVMLVVASFFAGIKDNHRVIAVFAGVKPAVAALIAASAWSLAAKIGLTWKKAFLIAIPALVVWLGGVSPVWVVVILVAAGIAFPWIGTGAGVTERKGGTDE